MGKGRTNYSIEISGDVGIAEQLVKEYLASNEFSLIEKEGEQFYKTGSKVEFARGFKYYFEGKNLNISVWLINSFGHDIELHESSMSMPSMEYKESLNLLFQKLADIEVQSQNNINDQNSAGEFVHNFQNDIDKKKERNCEIVFWVSIAGLFLALFGYMFGVFVYAIDFYYGVVGLKTRKKGKAIATIVLSVLSIVILIMEVLLSVTIF